MKRIWFPNAPSSSINANQRALIGVGIYEAIVLIDDTSYFRRYLVDSDVLDSPSASYAAEITANSTDLSYLRRYLGDS